MIWPRHLLLTIVFLGISAAAWAQTGTPDIAKLEADFQAQVDRISTQLEAGTLPDGSLRSDLDTLLDYRDQLQSAVETLSAQIEGPAGRLNLLGPPPEPTDPPESDDVAALRRSLNDEISRLTGLLKQAKLEGDEVEGLIRGLRNFIDERSLSQLIARSASPFTKAFWTDAIAEVGPAIDTVKTNLSDWWNDPQQTARRPANLTMLAAALAGVIAILLSPRWSQWRTLESALRAKTAPTALDKRRRAAFSAVSRCALAAVAAGLLYATVKSVGLMNETNHVFASRIWIAFAALVLLWNFASDVFSPRDERWRIVRVDSKAARQLFWLFTGIFWVYAADRVLDAGFLAAGAGPQFELTLSAVAGTLVAAMLWGFIGISQRQLNAGGQTPASPAAPDAKPGTAGPAFSVGSNPKHGNPWRDLMFAAGRVLATLIVAMTAVAYVALAGFVYHRLALIALFLILLYSVRVLVLWALSSMPFLATTPADATEQDQEKRRLGLGLRVAVDIALVTVGVPLFLLVVSYGGLEVDGWFEMLNSDMEIGAVSLSFRNILFAVLALLVISIGTRWAASIMDSKVLARTRMDDGERNSIVTLIKYAGIVLAVLVAFAIAGVGLSKLAIVAGGLSVGIGLGLQGVVNNFVSGLILLFERPVKIGDWIKISSGEGYVKHIGARATEIETFDRASVIVPNADLVTSAVQNWFHKNRVGRVRVAVGVSYAADPEQVRTILLDCATNNSSVMTSPAPFVVWTGFGASSLDFELRAYIWNYDNSLLVSSDLRFAIFKALREAGIEIPFPQRDLHIRSDSTKADPASE